MPSWKTNFRFTKAGIPVRWYNYKKKTNDNDYKKATCLCPWYPGAQVQLPFTWSQTAPFKQLMHVWEQLYPYLPFGHFEPHKSPLNEKLESSIIERSYS